jgi:hypothetical protein
VTMRGIIRWDVSWVYEITRLAYGINPPWKVEKLKKGSWNAKSWHWSCQVMLTSFSSLHRLFSFSGVALAAWAKHPSCHSVTAFLCVQTTLTGNPHGHACRTLHSRIDPMDYVRHHPSCRAFVRSR